MFKTLDVNGDGVLSPEELGVGIKKGLMQNGSRKKLSASEEKKLDQEIKV